MKAEHVLKSSFFTETLCTWWTFVKTDELTCCWVQELKNKETNYILNTTHYEKKGYLKKKKTWIQASVEDKEPRYNAKMMNIHILEAESNKTARTKFTKRQTNTETIYLISFQL